MTCQVLQFAIVFQIFIVASFAVQKCHRFGKSAYFPARCWSLSHNVYQTASPVSSAFCAQVCLFSPACVSFNYYRRGQLCELNDATRVQRPDELVPYEGGTYYDTSEETASYVCITGAQSLPPTTTESCSSYVTRPMDPYMYTYVLPHVNFGTSFRLDFSLRAPRNGNIALSSSTSDENIFYEIIVGGYENKKSAIRPCKACYVDQFETETVDILSADEDRDFWIEYREGNVSVGRGMNTSPFMEEAWYGGIRPNIVHVGVSTWKDATGHWKFPNFCA